MVNIYENINLAKPITNRQANKNGQVTHSKLTSNFAFLLVQETVIAAKWKEDSSLKTYLNLSIDHVYFS